MLTLECTLDDKVELEGVNVLTGKKSRMVIYPRSKGGFIFGINGESIPATLDNAYLARPLKTLGLAHCIGLRGNKEKVIKVEHVLSALYGMGIDHAYINVSKDGVVPRFDFGVKEIVDQITPVSVGSKRTMYTLSDELDDIDYVSLKGDSLQVHPSDGFNLEYHAEFPHKAVGSQYHGMEVTPENYKNEIMEARAILFLPFGSRFLIDSMSSIHGATDKNALLIGSREDEQYANTWNGSGSYNGDEFVRHKVMDAIGALALTGKRFSDVCFSFSKTGHEFDMEALRYFESKNAFVEI